MPDHFSIHIVREIEQSLAGVTNAPFSLRKAVFEWIYTSAEDVENFQAATLHDAEEIDFTVNAHPTRGSVGISTWNGGFQSLVWPDEKEIDIIELLEPSENGALRGVTSLPSTLVVRVPIELDFNLQQY